MSVRPEVLAVFAGMLAVTYGSRLAGMLLRAPLPPFWLRFLRFVPVAVFPALVAPELPGSRGEGPERALAAAVGALLAWRTRQLWPGLLGGMLAFWALRALL